MTHSFLGPLMVDVAGKTLTPEDCEVLRHPQVGGVILFTRNFENAGQLRGLVQAIRALREPQLLVAVDYEGGRVQRFRHQGFTVLPPARVFGRLYERDAERARNMAHVCGWMIGLELRAVGVDLCFAPVLDLAAGVSAVIGDRAFHADPAVVTDLGSAFMHGLRDAGMAATGKHFPGHGRVVEDSHEQLPVDDRPLEQIRSEDMVPFRELIRQGLPSVMMAHIRFSQVDARPASLSSFWIRDELRGRLGFTGAVFCDDLSMGGAAAMGGYPERAGLALDAGCDMLPVCNNRAAVLELLDALDAAPDAAATARLERLRAEPGRELAEIQSLQAWRHARDRLTVLT
ncbi:MAG TPA: beta-N-acetylhexosaminidase [Nevskiales bacterium]|nr:beta-N-acetylhexosaminidase [Nevskiales bacterium]